MTQLIPISAVPNQKLSVNLAGSRYEISLQLASGVMLATVARDAVTVVSGHRLVAGEPVLPYLYQEAGNFIVVTDNEALPIYTEFGITQFLLYVSQGEIDGVR